MSASIILTLPRVSQQITIYAGSIVYLAGIIGSLLNITVFFSLRTFHENPCAFYLIVMSFFNICNLTMGLLSRILMAKFEIDWTLISPFYCKFRWYILQFGILTSFSCICLAAIDQYMATSAGVRRRQWSSVKIAHRLVIIFIIIWSLHGIPYLIYFDLILSPATGKFICTSINIIFRQYHTYGYLITLAGVLPLTVSIFFGLLAHNNIQNSAHRTIPLVQRHLDKQLTTMVLDQLLLNFIFTLPYTILTTLTSFLSSSIKDPVIMAGFDFATIIAILLYYLSFACLFYIYMFASERFRQQLIYVLFKKHWRRWRPPIIAINHVTPHS